MEREAKKHKLGVFLEEKFDLWRDGVALKGSSQLANTSEMLGQLTSSVRKMTMREKW